MIWLLIMLVAFVCFGLAAAVKDEAVHSAFCIVGLICMAACLALSVAKESW